MLSLLSSATTFLVLIGLASSQSVNANNCPGVLHIGSGSSSVCCVGGTLPPVVLSTCPGWPICTGPATTSQSRGPLSCATAVPVSASNYDQIVSSASASLAASGTTYRTTLADTGATVSGSSTITSAPAGSSASPSGASSSKTGAAVAVSANGGALVAAAIGALGASIVALGML